MPGLTVNAGQTFLLVVDNWTNNTQGYTITFTGTAQYFDTRPPKMDSTGQLCAGSFDNQIDYLRQIFVRFGELISPTTIAANGSDFVVQDVASGTLVPITAAAPINPPQTNQVRLTVGSPLVPGQTYKILGIIRPVLAPPMANLALTAIRLAISVASLFLSLTSRRAVRQTLLFW
jgi:hypothetical protein